MRLLNRIIPNTPAQKEDAPRPATAVRPFEVPAALRLPATPAILGNERGVALVMALVLGLVGMLMITALFYMVGTGTWTSGSKKRYQTALESSHGGMNFFAKEIIQLGVGGENLSAMGNYGGVLTQQINDANFILKLTTIGNTTHIFGDAAYPADNPDATLTLAFTAPTPNMTVTNTILSTAIGNSSLSRKQLIIGGVTETASGQSTGQHIPYLFQTETRSQSAVNSRERARLSSIYAY